MLDILVGEAFATRTLREPNPFSESFVVGLAVGSIQCTDRVPTFNAYRHPGMVFGEMVVESRDRKASCVRSESGQSA